jgi:hypothetical protein
VFRDKNSILEGSGGREDRTLALSEIDRLERGTDASEQLRSWLKKVFSAEGGFSRLEVTDDPSWVLGGKRENPPTRF